MSGTTIRSETTTLPRLLRAEDVSADTGLPLWRIWELAREGAIPVVKLGRAVRFSAPAVRDWIEAGGTAQNGHQD